MTSSLGQFYPLRSVFGRMNTEDSSMLCGVLSSERSLNLFFSSLKRFFSHSGSLKTSNSGSQTVF